MMMAQAPRKEGGAQIEDIINLILLLFVISCIYLGLT